MTARNIVRFVIGPLAGAVCLMPAGRAWVNRPFCSQGPRKLRGPATTRTGGTIERFMF